MTNNIEKIKCNLEILNIDCGVLDKLARQISDRLRLFGWDSPDPGFYDFKSKVDTVVEYFADDGLTRDNYLRAIVKQPGLLCMKPATIVAHIDGVCAHFEADGLNETSR